MGRFYQCMYTRGPDLYVVCREQAALCFGSQINLRQHRQMPTAIATKIKLSFSF
jgi:hypothetical protein